mgnify:CR=1 FL=1
MTDYYDEIKDLQAKQSQLEEDYLNEERRVKQVQETMDQTKQQLHQSFYEILEDTLAVIGDEDDDLRQQAVRNFEQSDQELSETYRKSANEVQEEWDDFQVKNKQSRQELSDQITELKGKESSDG